MPWQSDESESFALSRQLVASHFHFYLLQAPGHSYFHFYIQVSGGLACTTGEGVVPGLRLWHLNKWVLLVESLAKVDF